jgi:uncharacterized protein
MKNAPLGDADVARLQDLLDELPEPLEPLDPMALDGFLCGVILQPQRLPAERWLKFVCDIEGRALPAGFVATELNGLVERRHAELAAAIAGRQWFDPWVYQMDDDATASETVLPWVAGFAAAMDLFPALMRVDDPELIEPLALMYRHFDADDLEDAETLLAVIDTLEPPKDLAEAVEDLVRSLMLMADVTQPRAAVPHKPVRGQAPRKKARR